MIKIVPRDQISKLSFSLFPRGRPTKNPDEWAANTVHVRVKTLTPEYQLVAHLISIGLSNAEIAKELGILPARVSIIRNSPVIREEVKRLTVNLEPEVSIEAIRRRVFGTFSDSIEKCVELRDGADDQAVQAGMAKFLVQTNVEINIPKKQLIEEHKKVAVVVIKADDVQEFRQLMAEDTTLDTDELEALELEAGDWQETESTTEAEGNGNDN